MFPLEVILTGKNNFGHVTLVKFVCFVWYEPACYGMS